MIWHYEYTSNQAYIEIGTLFEVKSDYLSK